MMQHPPPACDGAVHSSPTTSTVQEEEEDRTLWMGELQNWMDKVEEKEFRTLWIGNLQHCMDEAYIDSCFAHTGEIFTSKVIRNGPESSDQCYGGFIEFKSRTIAEGILLKFNGTPMPRTNFTLNWASFSSSSFGSKEDDSAAAADDDKIQKIVTTDSLLPHGTRTPQPTELSLNSGWEDVLKWWSIIAKETRTPNVVYAAHRVYMIGAFIKNIYDAPPKELIEELLDELPLHVVSIDIAKVFHSIDALSPLLGNLVHQPAGGIPVKATKAISAMVQNNPTSQQLVMKAGGIDVLLDNFLRSIDTTLVTVSLEAISSLFWNEEFGRDEVYEYLSFILEDTQNISIQQLHKKAQNISAPHCQRKALILIARLVLEHNSDYKIVNKLEYPRMMIELVVYRGDTEVRKAALRCLNVLANVEKVVNSGQGVKIVETLEEFLQAGIEGIISMAPQYRAHCSQEIQLMDKLWSACYDKPSSLREKGLVELSTPASDDVSRAWAAVEAAIPTS